VTQVSYQQAPQQVAPPCCAASAPAQTAAPQQTYVQPNTTTNQPTVAPGVTNQPPASTGVTEPPPSFPSNTSTPATSTSNRPAEATTPVTPEPNSETEKKDPYEVNQGDNSTYLEAPKLFNPKDRTAQRGSIAPVRTAVYQQPVAYRATAAKTVSRGPVSDEQARIDAIGWSSASK
jgi:hypothetical protein